MKEKEQHGFCETPEVKCSMNYCEEHGCQNRKRELVEPAEQEGFGVQWKLRGCNRAKIRHR
jgi:hypothetical protein